MMKALAVAATAVTLMAGSAAATTVPAIGTNASYDGIFTANNAYPNHGLWLPGLVTDGDGQTLSKHWSVDSSQSTATLDNGLLSLTGVVSNLDDSNLQLSFNLNLVEIMHNGSAACGNSSTSGSSCNSVDATDVAERDRIKFFALDTNSSSKITGIGALSGLDLSFAIKPSDGSKPPQMGFGGNWRTMDFGYSNWFTYEANVASIGDFSFAQGVKSGDVNLTFTDNVDELEPEPVPLPAGLPLLIGGLAVFGVLRRRQKV